MLPLLLLSFFFFARVLGSPSDILYIQKLVADEGILVDAKNFAGLVNIFTPNATYNAGTPSQDVFGIDNIEAILSAILPPGSITHNAVSTQSYTLGPPFDEQGSAGTATGVVYITVSYIGQGDLSGQALVFFGKYDDSYVKSGDRALYGGWRINKRVFVGFVSFPKVNQLQTETVIIDFDYCLYNLNDD